MKLKTTRICPACTAETDARQTSCPRCGRGLSSAVYAFSPWWARLLATWFDLLLVFWPVAGLERLISPPFADSAAGVWLAIASSTRISS